MTIKTAPGQFSAHVHLMDRHRHRNEKSTVQIPANTLVFLNRAFCFVRVWERCRCACAVDTIGNVIR